MSAIDPDVTVAAPVLDEAPVCTVCGHSVKFHFMCIYCGTEPGAHSDHCEACMFERKARCCNHRAEMGGGQYAKIIGCERSTWNSAEPAVCSG